MKFLAVVLMSILAYATGESEYLEFELNQILVGETNKWIPIKEKKNQIILEVNVLQEITGDDWMVYVETTINHNRLPDVEMPLCSPAETIQNGNMIQLLKKALGLENQNCPIQPQSITNPEKRFGGNFEVENYDEVHQIRITMLLIKNDEPMLWLNLIHKR